MKPFCGSRIFKRSIINFDKIAFAEYLKSTEIAVFGGVLVKFLVNGQMLK